MFNKMAIVSSIVYEIIIFYLASTYNTFIDPMWVRDRASRDANQKGLPATLEGEGGFVPSSFVAQEKSNDKMIERARACWSIVYACTCCLARTQRETRRIKRERKRRGKKSTKTRAGRGI